MVFLLGACGAPTPVETEVIVELTPSPTTALTITPDSGTDIGPAPTPQPYPEPQLTIPTSASQLETPDAYPPPPADPEASPGQTAYPPPGSQTEPGQAAYPPPGTEMVFPTSAAYPPPVRETPAATLEATPPSFPTFPAPVLTPGVTPIDRLPVPAMTPPSPGAKTVTIWHAWNDPQAQVLEEVLAAYQRLFPDVYFDVLYVPYDDLLMTFKASAYQGRGPSLLLGPAEWGPELYEEGLVASVEDLAIPEFLERINPAALETARYRGTLISLPHSIREGVVMYRNRQIIPQAPDSYTKLVSVAKEATRGGRVGAYLERGFYYSAGHLLGSGGQLMDHDGKPAFNNQEGVEWLNLLMDFEQAGAASLNTNRDLDLFKAGKVGIIIDGTWNRQVLENALGEGNLVIDPWPTYKDGHLSGFIKTDNIFLTARAIDDERYASLQFIGFMLAPEVQAVLTRANHIPALSDVDVGMEWMQQLMAAFEGAAPYPSHPYARLYWDPLEAAMGDVFSGAALPEPALRQASQTINTRIQEIQANP